MKTKQCSYCKEESLWLYRTVTDRFNKLHTCKDCEKVIDELVEKLENI